MHVTLNICSAENAIATDLCPADMVTETNYVLIRPDSMFYQFEDEYLLKAFPNAVRTELTTDEFIASMKTCTVHSEGSLSIFELKTNAQDLIQQATDYLNTATGIPDDSRNTILDDIAALEVALTGYEYSVIEPLYTTLQTDFTALQSLMAGQTQGDGG